MAKKKPEAAAPSPPPRSPSRAGAARDVREPPRGEPIMAARYYHYAGEDVVWLKDCRESHPWIRFPTSDPAAKQMIQAAFATRGFRVTAFVVDDGDGPTATAVSIETT